MKKLFAVVLAVLLMASFTVTALAEISPTASTITTTTGSVPNGSNDSSTAPQTGYMLLVPAIALAAAGAAGVAVKKLSAKD